MTNTELFESYLFDQLSGEEKAQFEARLISDPSLSEDFKVYLVTLKGLISECEQENIEFGRAMKKIPKEDLERIVGNVKMHNLSKFRSFRRNRFWISSVAAVILVAIVMIGYIRQSGLNRVDDLIVAYNYDAGASKGAEEDFEVRDISVMSSDELHDYISFLKKQYEDCSDSDIYNKQASGMRLALAYLKLHDRKKARKLLIELKNLYPEDKAFAGQCNEILESI